MPGLRPTGHSACSEAEVGFVKNTSRTFRNAVTTFSNSPSICSELTVSRNRLPCLGAVGGGWRHRRVGGRESAFLLMRHSRVSLSKERMLRILRIHCLEWLGVVVLAFLAFVLLGTSDVMAQTFDEAKAAYKRGDYAIAMEAFRNLAEQGDTRAQFVLGSMYAEGKGVSQDEAEAVRWYRRAGEEGLVGVQLLLGTMYDSGKGVSQDYAEAARWYRLAAEQGDARAQVNLGYMYSQGRGVSQDYAEALRWFRQAAEQGNAKGQTRLGIMYEQGYGVPQDYAEALRWYRQAAAQGNAFAQASLGFMHYLGKGVSQDYVQAHKWFSLAAPRFSSSERDSQDRAMQFREKVASKMTPEQLAEAQRLAREWKAGQ